MIDHKGVIFVEYDIELSISIGQRTVYDEDEIREWCDWSYKYALHKKQNRTFMTNPTWYGLSEKFNMTMMWLIV